MSPAAEPLSAPPRARDRGSSVELAAWLARNANALPAVLSAPLVDALRRIGGARRHLVDHQPGAGREIVPHAAVHHREADAVLPRQHTDGRTAGQEVLDHLPGHVARVGRDATRGQAVVTGKYHQLGVFQHGHFAAQGHADALRQAFDLAQRTDRLGLVVQQVLQARSQRGLDDVVDGGNGEGHGSSFE